MNGGGWRLTWARIACLGVALAAPAARANPATLAPAQVEETVQVAAAHFKDERPAEALTLLEGLVVRLGPIERRRHPLIDVMIGRCLSRLGRATEAIDAFDRALAWAAPGTSAHQRATRYRAELLATAFGAVRVECGPAVERVRLVERGETRACPASWPALPVGEWTFEGLPPRPGFGAVRQTVAAGREARLRLPAAVGERPGAGRAEAAEAAGDWRLGLRLGMGLATIAGRNDVVVDTWSGLGWRAALAVEAPISARIGWAVEGGVGGAEMGFSVAGASPGAQWTLRWLMVEAAALLRVCWPGPRRAVCVVPGVGGGWLIDATESGPGGERPVEAGRGELHAGLRLGADARFSVSGVELVAGLHGAWSPWPGAIEFANGSLAAARGWVELGVVY